MKKETPKHLPKFHSGGPILSKNTPFFAPTDIFKSSSRMFFRLLIHKLTNKQIAMIRLTADEDWKLLIIKREIADCDRDINDSAGICDVGKKLMFSQVSISDYVNGNVSDITSDISEIVIDELERGLKS